MYNKNIKSILPAILLLILIVVLFSQSVISITIAEQEEADKSYNKGLIVSPSHIRFNIDKGETSIRKIRISNQSSAKQCYIVSYSDFDISNEGISSCLKPGTIKYSMSKYVQIFPTILEIDPEESVEITIDLTIPPDQDKKSPAWGVILLKEILENDNLSAQNNSLNSQPDNDNSIVAFKIWLFQNPPDISVRNVNITEFQYEKQDQSNLLRLNVENKGNGISFCNAYVELTNLSNEKQNVLGGKRYTILPGYKRTFLFDLTSDLPKGRYLAVGVLDHMSDADLKTTQLEFNIK